MSCNVLGKVEWKKQNQSWKSDKQLYPYGSDQPMKVMASFNALIVTANVSLQAKFIVVYGKGQSLLGHDTALKLGVFKLGTAAEINNIRDNSELFEK